MALLLHRGDLVHQPGQLEPFLPQIQRPRILRQAEDRQHPQPIPHVRLAQPVMRLLVDDHTHPMRRQRSALNPGQLPRPIPQHRRLHRHLQPHRSPLLSQRRRHRTQHLPADPLPDLFHNLGLMRQPTIRGRVPPQIPVQVLERLKLPRGRVQLHLMISQKHPTRIGQPPPPPRRPAELQHLQPQPRIRRAALPAAASALTPHRIAHRDSLPEQPEAFRQDRPLQRRHSGGRTSRRRRQAAVGGLSDLI